MVRRHWRTRPLRSVDDLDVRDPHLGRQLELLETLGELALDLVVEAVLGVGEIRLQLHHLRVLRSVNRARASDLTLEVREVCLQRPEEVATDSGRDGVRVHGGGSATRPLAPRMEAGERAFEPPSRELRNLEALLAGGAYVFFRDAVGDGGGQRRIGDSGGDLDHSGSLDLRYVDVRLETGRARLGVGERRMVIEVERGLDASQQATAPDPFVLGVVVGLEDPLVESYVFLGRQF